MKELKKASNNEGIGKTIIILKFTIKSLKFVKLLRVHFNDSNNNHIS